MWFDDTLRNIGEFGCYQKKIYILICLPIIFIAMSDVNNAMLLYTPRHSCDGFKETEKEIQYGNWTSDSELDLVERGQCFTTNNITGMVDIEREACHSWSYDRSVFKETFVSEHDLVCDRSMIPANMQLLMYGGALFGSLLQGIIADRFGRKQTLCISLLIVMLSGVLSIWSPNYYVFTGLRFVQIMMSRGVYLSAFILGIELVGPSKRRLAGFLFTYFYTSGIVLLSAIGYGMRHWKYIQIACSAPVAIFLVYWCIIPESPRWLISHQRLKEARNIVMKIAKSNKTESLIYLNNDVEEEKKEPQRNTMRLFFKSRQLVCHSLIVSINIFVVFLCYFGFALNLGNLVGDFYVNFLLTGLAEYPADTIALVLGDRIGRKKLYISGMLIAGTSFLSSAASAYFKTDDFTMTPTIMAMIGKTGIMIGFCTIYVWSAEIYPTVVRNFGMGISTAFGNIGYIASAYVSNIASSFPGKVATVMPLILFGTLSLVAAFLTLFLPETQNEQLPETVQHVKDLRRKPEVNIPLNA